jgi:2-oxoglutarate ferredoxin oxidoreductase subunit beta
MDLTVLLHDNHIYGLTKMQASPTSPKGLRSKTTPRGTYLDALNPLSVTLGIQNASFVAQAVDWIPELVYEVISRAFHHKGCSFVRIIQRCPEFLPELLDPWMSDPNRVLLLTHENGMRVSASLGRVYRNQREHDPADIDAAREIASLHDVTPVGILYHDPTVPCYEDLHGIQPLRGAELIRQGLEAELDKFTIWPQEVAAGRP